MRDHALGNNGLAQDNLEFAWIILRLKVRREFQEANRDQVLRLGDFLCPGG